jgi:hypothetical protein
MSGVRRFRLRALSLFLALTLSLAACTDADCVACLVPEAEVGATGELAFRLCLSSAPQAMVEASRCAEVALSYIAED